MARMRFLRLCILLFCLLTTLALLAAGGLALAAAYYNAPPEELPHWLLSGGESGLPGISVADNGVAGNGTGNGLPGAVPAVLFEVREGESAYAAGARLEQAGLIKTRRFWNVLSRLEKEYLKAGTYRIILPASQTEIRAALVEGRQVLLRVTVPEGVTLKKAAAIFGQTGICSAEDFLAAAEDPSIVKSYHIPGATMEGYLYPDTYFFPGAFPAERVVRTMADTFFDRLREIAPESVSLSPKELNDKVILASIVEREYRVDDEAPLMAGVFYNRIKIGMGLESCATVEYIITEIQGKPHPHVLYFIDIEVKHPYNTYVNPGLPPGPISLPGRTALSAVFHPADTDYLYFRLVDEAAGRHYFSKTFDDHIKAGALFVKG